MFKSRGEGNVVYKCSVRLLDDSFLELEFQVEYFDMLCIALRNLTRKILENFNSHLIWSFQNKKKFVLCKLKSGFELKVLQFEWWFKTTLENFLVLSQYYQHPGDHFSLPFNNFLSIDWEFNRLSEVYNFLWTLRVFSKREEVFK